MPRKKSHSVIQKDLAKFIEPYEGMTVEVEHSDRWDRTCLSFRWSGFNGLLSEERFRLLMLVIPEEYLDDHLQGVFWFEMDEKETIDDCLKHPRSEDIESREKPLAKALLKTKFFEMLEKELGSLSVEECMQNLNRSRAILKKLKLSKEEITDYCLLLIRHGAYCDADVLIEARNSIEESK